MGGQFSKPNNTWGAAPPSVPPPWSTAPCLPSSPSHPPHQTSAGPTSPGDTRRDLSPSDLWQIYTPTGRWEGGQQGKQEVSFLRRKRQGSDVSRTYVDSYLNNFMITRNITSDDDGTKLKDETEVPENLIERYLSWQPLIGGNTSCEGELEGTQVNASK